MYSAVDVLIINKIDLLPYVPFNMEYFITGVKMLNPGLISFSISCKTDEGLGAWVNWMKNTVADFLTGINDK